MDTSNLINHIEALIFASEKPLTALDMIDLINNAFGLMDDRIALDQVETSIEGIRRSMLLNSILLSCGRAAAVGSS